LFAYDLRSLTVCRHGLSYTTFAISNIQTSTTETVVDIENTGTRSGAEVLRLYVAFACTAEKGKSRFIRPKRTLAGFHKVFLEAGQKQTVKLPITRDGTSVWDEKVDSWCSEGGEYVASIVTGEQSLDQGFVIEKDVFWSGL